MCEGWKPITYTAGRAFSARGFWSGGGRGNTISLGEREGRLFFYIDRSGIGWSRPIFCILQRLCAPMLFTGHENRHEGRGQLFLVFLVQIQSSWLVYTFCWIVLEVHWPYHWMQHSIAIFLQWSLGKTCHSSLKCKNFKKGYYFLLIFFISKC